MSQDLKTVFGALKLSDAVVTLLGFVERTKM